MNKKINTSNKYSTLKLLPYGKQHLDKNDILKVTKVLQSDWITQGPTITQFEKALCKKLGVKYAVACSSGTAALHLSILAANIKKNDIVITSDITFLASANCATYVQAKVILCDIDPNTGLMSINSLKRLLSNKQIQKRVKAIIPVHFAGQPTNLEIIFKLAQEVNALVIDDCAHALGAGFKDKNNIFYNIGASPYSHMSCFSFHPVKHITTGEGGAITTNNEDFYNKLILFRNHGINRNPKLFINTALAYDKYNNLNPWYYEMLTPGFNYRMTDIQAALGISQLKKLNAFIKKRQSLAAFYKEQIKKVFPPNIIRPLDNIPNTTHAYHLFVILINFNKISITKAQLINELKNQGISTQVHYIPLHLQPYYAHKKHYISKLINAEKYYEQALTIPLFTKMTKKDCIRVINTLQKIIL